MLKRYIRFLGILFTLASIYYIIHTIIKINFDYSLLTFDRIEIFLLVSSIICCTIIIYLFAFAWIIILKHITYQEISWKRFIQVYIKTNIGKYLPGNVMHFAARNVIGKKHGITHVKLGFSSALEILFILGTLFIFLITFKSEELFKTVNTIQIPRTIGIIIITVILLFGIILFYYKKQFFYHFLKNISVFKIILAFFKASVIYILIFIILGIILSLFIHHFGAIQLTLNDYLQIILYYAIAWITGLVVIGAPGGIGIRESILVLLLSPFYGKSIILLAALLHRIIFLLGEFLAFGLGFINKNK